MTQIINPIIHYINSLDWSYILTFILLSFVINQPKVMEWLFKLTKVKIQTRYRVLIIGVLYGVFLYFLRGYSLLKIECLLQSFVFAIVFHKLILEKLFSQLFNFRKQSDVP